MEEEIITTGALLCESLDSWEDAKRGIAERDLVDFAVREKHSNLYLRDNQAESQVISTEQKQSLKQWRFHSLGRKV